VSVSQASLPAKPRILQAEPVPLRAPTAAQQAVSPLQRIAFFVAVVVLFLVHSRVLEQLGGATYLLRILSILAIVLVILTGGLWRALSNRPAALFGLLTALFLVSVPFSAWKGGSVDLMFMWFRSLLYFVILAGAVISVRQCKTAMYTLACGGVAIGIQSIFAASDTSDRLRFEAAGSLSNPNDLAFYLIFSVPCCILLTLTARKFIFKALGAVSALGILLAVFRTGSRGGMVLTCVLFALVFAASSPTLRLVGTLSLAVLLAVGASLAPRSVLDRYREFAASGAENPEAGMSSEERNAIASSINRMDLLKTSIRYTLRHPFLGVGPGMFGVAVTDDYKRTMDQQESGTLWLATHDTYTQISSEDGIPALIVFVSILVYGLRSNFRLYRSLRGRPELTVLRHCAWCLWLTFILYAVNGVFMSIGYAAFLPILTALTFCVQRAASAQVRALDLTRQKSQPAGVGAA
jgi:O-antigen ligase